jgi:hypothetical protein
MDEKVVKNILFITVYISLFIQFVTGVVDLYVIQLDHPDEVILLKKLLVVELLVQIVEGIFYVWMTLLFTKIANITPKRYFDWMITTPTMLFTLCIYLDYLHESLETHPHQNKTLLESFEKNSGNLIVIFILNWLMLFFGYLGEIGVLNNVFAVILGFIPFFIYFKMIYDNYAKYTPSGMYLFWVFSGIWSFYGIAALMSYYWKNIFYNILDIFAKNFFGIFLAYVVMKKSMQL